jgi:hypothetical protein
MHWQDSFDGLQLQDHFILDDHIYFVSAIELQSLIRDRKIDLAFEGQPAKVQFMAQALFISGFQQSRPELAVHLDRSSNDLAGSRIPLIFVFSVSL